MTNSTKLIMQSITGHRDTYGDYVALSAPVHELYAEACDADYWLFVGWQEPGLHPSWNRIPMFIEAFEEGYQKVVWLDADTLVVNQEVNIFNETDWNTPLLMCRRPGIHEFFPWIEPGWDIYDDGVTVANACSETHDALRYVWDERQSPQPHHVPDIWQLNATNDYVFAHPDTVGQLPDRWNWMPWLYGASPREDAVILGWHGMPYQERWEQFRLAYRDFYGT